MRRALIVVCTLAAVTAVAGAEARERRDGFVFSTGGNLYSTNIDIEEAVRLKKGRAADFLWFRRDGKAYLVTDASVLEQGHEILRPSRELSRRQEAVSARLRPYEERERELDDEDERLEQREERLEGREDRTSSEERRRLEARRSELEAQKRALKDQMQEIEADERQLEEREDEIERVADAAVARLIDDALRRGLARPLR